MPQKILVVEDEKSIQSLVGFKLRNCGFEVFTAMDGQEALNLLAHTMVDLILLDLMMPVLSGKEVLIALKKNPLTQNIPVVILSARSLEKEVIDSLTLGADDYIKKPFSPSELVARVRSVLSRTNR